MKKIIVIFLISIVITLSCSTSRINNSNSKFENCLPDTFGIDLKLFVNSFDEFVNRNHEGNLESFISSVIRRNFPNKRDFNKSDFDLANRLRANGFRNFIFTDYEEKISDMEIAPPRTANDSEDESRKMIKVDIDKPYLNCLSKIQTNGKLIREYVRLQTDNPSISPLIIGKLFLSNKLDDDYKTKHANTIIAVELYYMILDAANKR